MSIISLNFNPILKLDFMTGTTNTCNRSQGHSTTVNTQPHAFHLFRVRTAFVNCFQFSNECLRLPLHKLLYSNSQRIRMLSVCVCCFWRLFHCTAVQLWTRILWFQRRVTETTHFPNGVYQRLTVMCYGLSSYWSCSAAVTSGYSAECTAPKAAAMSTSRAGCHRHAYQIHCRLPRSIWLLRWL